MHPCRSSTQGRCTGWQVQVEPEIICSSLLRRGPRGPERGRHLYRVIASQRGAGTKLGASIPNATGMLGQRSALCPSVWGLVCTSSSLGKQALASSHSHRSPWRAVWDLVARDLCSLPHRLETADQLLPPYAGANLPFCPAEFQFHRGRLR